MKILLLLGGESGERDVSLVSGRACASALAGLGHELLLLDPLEPERVLPLAEFPFGEGLSEREEHLSSLDAAQIQLLMNTLAAQQPELVFNCLHGGMGENGKLAVLLELLGLRHSSGPSLAMQLAMDKHRSKAMMTALGISTPDWLLLPLVATDSDPAPASLVTRLGLPLIVKPNTMGSSVGISLCEREDQIEGAIERVRELGDDVLVEEYIPGRELTVSWLGGESLPVVEIKPREGWYDYRHKYLGGTEYQCPAEIRPELAQRLATWTCDLNRMLGCRGVTRTDFRLDLDEQAFCLELNTTPGMTATSLVPKAAAAVGVDFAALMTRMLALASE